MSAKIAIQDLNLSFVHENQRVPVLSNLNLTLNDGEFLAVIGPSGCGKSTILRAISGLIQPDSGQIQVDGQTATGTPERVGMVFQNDCLLPWQTVSQNIELGFTMRGISPAQSKDNVRKLINLVHLNGFANAVPRQLSGGMRKRVALARAIAYEPDVFLMDEPFGPLDAQTRISIGQEFLRIWGQLGKSVIFVTHDIEEAIALADRVVVFSNRPASVHAEFKIDLPRPRDFYEIRFHPHFRDIHEAIWHSLASLTPQRRESANAT